MNDSAVRPVRGWYLTWGVPPDRRSVTFAWYTGQESAEDRDRILARGPDILLTNYVMLEYLLTRPHERLGLIGAAGGLRFLVLDELHTYRGRQGADVALLVRRLRDACDSPAMQCVGTSATMATARTFAEAQREVAAVASRLFGTDVPAGRVIGETLERATEARRPGDAELRAALDATLAATTLPRARGYRELTTDPLAIWVEDTFGLAVGPDGRVVRQQPTTLPQAAEELAERTGRPVAACATAIRVLLTEGAATRHPEHGRPLFAFRLHQFPSKSDTVHVSLEPEGSRHITSQYQVSVPGDRDKVLLPLAFCRECGQEYLVVARRSRTPTPALVGLLPHLPPKPYIPGSWSDRSHHHDLEVVRQIFTIKEINGQRKPLDQECRCASTMNARSFIS